MQKAVLIVLDGFGIGKDSPFNAIKNAKIPFFQQLLKHYPHSELLTHGEAVGLPKGVMGNSEVGHMTMGAGRIIYQDLTRITKEIETRNFFKNPVIRKAIETGASKTGRVHLMGLLSDGGVHSHIDHLLALLDLCAEMKVPQICVHAFLDGRDTPPDSSSKYVQTLLRHPTFTGQAGSKASLVSIAGRYYAMDRDKRWDRVGAAYQCMTGQNPGATVPGIDALQAIERSHANGKTDEFVEPILLDPKNAIQDDDSVIFFNYRSDRARELSVAFNQEDFQEFNRGSNSGRGVKLSSYIGMTQYDANFTFPYAYGPQNLNNIMGEWLEKKSLSQFKIAETEKYAHVTFFFNGGREKPFQNEERILVPSPRDVPTYDLKPEMSAYEVAREAAAQIGSGKHDFVLMNFANADMVGHTGNYEATVKAIQTLDACLAQVIGTAERAGYHTLLTADHGNAEEMCAHDTGGIHTQHTLNPVPAIWVAPGSAISPKSSKKALLPGSLEDVMPTLCDMMGLPLPPEVTGKSLLPRQ